MTEEIVDPNKKDSTTEVKDKKDEKEGDEFQKIRSWIGRLEAQQKEDREISKKVLSKMDEMMEAVKTQTPNTQKGNDFITGLNEELSDMVLSGNVVGAFDKLLSVKGNAENSLRQQNLQKLDKELSKLEGQPLFSDLSEKVKKNASALVESGYDPEIAANIVWNKEKADYMGGILATLNQKNPGALEMLKGGKSGKEEPEKGKLPPDFKKACERDIKAGVFKDEAEYIASMAPALRKQLGV